MAEQVSEDLVDLAADTLTGDIASWLIDRLRGLESAYRYLTEDQQREVIAEAKQAAWYMVRQAVGIIAAGGRETIPVTVEKVENDGKRIKVTMEASRLSEHRHTLFDAAGCEAHLSIADPGQFAGGEAPAPEPDQPELPDAEADAPA